MALGPRFLLSWPLFPQLCMKFQLQTWSFQLQSLTQWGFCPVPTPLDCLLKSQLARRGTCVGFGQPKWSHLSYLLKDIKTEKSEVQCIPAPLPSKSSSSSCLLIPLTTDTSRSLPRCPSAGPQRHRCPEASCDFPLLSPSHAQHPHRWGVDSPALQLHFWTWPPRITL